MKKIFAISILIMSAIFLTPVYGNAEIATGNWYLQASSQLSAGGASQIPQIGGSLMQSGTIISGVLHISDSKCFDFGEAIPVSGTIDGANVSLTSTGETGEVITITGTANINVIMGSYNIQSGCARGDYGTVTATLLSPATGSWNGTLTSGKTTAPASAAFSQDLPNDDGYSLLSGTITFSGSKCNVSGAFTDEQSWVLGNVVQGIAKLNDGGVMALNGFITDTTTAANKMTLNFSIKGGACAGQTGSVTLIRP